MLTMNADSHALMRRMHKPDPKLAPHEQDKRSVSLSTPAIGKRGFWVRRQTRCR
jgi:hypothetical protein